MTSLANDFLYSVTFLYTEWKRRQGEQNQAAAEAAAATS